MIDCFRDDRRAGTVVGSETEDGTLRKGVDPERVIGIDNGALRIQPLVKSGWGRSGIAYGPYKRENGLALGVFLVNGHNTSQAEPLPEGFRSRLVRWALGSETEEPLVRIRRWFRGRQRKFMWRRLKQWFRTGSKHWKVPMVDENLAVGWFPRDATGNPVKEGNSFIIHALGPECGGLWVRGGLGYMQTVCGLQNVQIYYFVVLREQGAAYYAASIPGVPGLASVPKMRLLAIDPFNADQKVYAGIHQSVLGQIGFRVDTRVYCTQIVTLPNYEHWYGSAHGADSLVGQGPLQLSNAEIGGSWQVTDGGFERTDTGLSGRDETNTALLDLSLPSGLLHLLVTTKDAAVDGVGLIWRGKDEDNFWCFEVGSGGCRLSIKENGVWSRFPKTCCHCLVPNCVNSVQVADDGGNVRLYLNGELVYSTTLSDSRLQEGTGVGIQLTGDPEAALLESFEAHPREIPVPPEFDLGRPWRMQGEKVVLSDDFSGPAGELAGRVTTTGGERWSRTIGEGVFRLTGEGSVKVDASVERPNPGRTVYTIAWEHTDLADVEVNITPPGTGRGQNEFGRGGLVFWQDSRNYISLNLWMNDDYGFSISSFFYIDGYEELYDAVWTNIGRRVYWGTPFDFRAAFDGNHYIAYVNREPVLYRALTDVYPDVRKLEIRRIGILANWEWGNDTGSVFKNFIARTGVPNASDLNDARTY